MAKKRSSKRSLRVVCSGTRTHIDVPTGRAQELHTYLRQHGVRSAPPEPSSSDVDSIELARDVDVVSVQALLDRWA